MFSDEINKLETYTYVRTKLIIHKNILVERFMLKYNKYLIHENLIITKNRKNHLFIASKIKPIRGTLSSSAYSINTSEMF